jgi:hypothetical protein
MLVAKQVADLITIARGLVAFCLVWVGMARGAAGLSLAAWLMLCDWMGDMLDGRIARRSRIQYRTWIGDHDLEVDMAVSLGLLAYLILAGFVNPWLAGAYVLSWFVYFWGQRGISHSLGMLFQAPVYSWLIWVALHQAPPAGWTIVIFLALVVLITWPYFPKVMVPGFLAGLRREDHRE